MSVQNVAHFKLLEMVIYWCCGFPPSEVSPKIRLPVLLMDLLKGYISLRMLCSRFDITNQIPRRIQDHCEELDLLKPGYREPDRKDITCNKPGFEFPPSESIC